MANRPEIIKKESTEKKLHHDIQPELAQAALRYWMKRHFPEYRAFKDDELEFIFHEDGSVTAEGWTEKRK